MKFGENSSVESFKSILQLNIRVAIRTSSGQTIIAPDFPPFEGFDLKYEKLYVLSAQDVHNLVATFFSNAELR